jgi:ADP-ribose pyrophosphatase
MALKPLKKISGFVKFKNKWWDYVVDRYKLPNGNESEYHFVHTSGSAFIIPVCEDGKILMIKQYRYLNDRISLELPGGGIKEGETKEQAAHNELIQETGYDGQLENIGFFNPYSGVTDELCYVFIAKNLYPSKKSLPDESEEFEVLRLTKEEIDEKIYSNEIFSGMTMASWAIARKKIFRL